MNKRRNKKTKDSKDKGLDENSQEAIEVNNIEEDNGEEIDEEPEEGIDIENENYDDYREIPELDKYEKELIIPYIVLSNICTVNYISLSHLKQDLYVYDE